MSALPARLRRLAHHWPEVALVAVSLLSALSVVLAAFALRQVAEDSRMRNRAVCQTTRHVALIQADVLIRSATASRRRDGLPPPDPRDVAAYRGSLLAAIDCDAISRGDAATTPRP